MKASHPAAKPPLLAPDACVAGEEDPGAALDDPDFSVPCAAPDPQRLPIQPDALHPLGTLASREMPPAPPGQTKSSA